MFFYDSIEIHDERLLKFDNLFLCVVRYETGDSFGRTYGAWHLVGLAPTYEIAKLTLEQHMKSDAYKPWQGYFERFQDTEIHELTVY